MSAARPLAGAKVTPERSRADEVVERGGQPESPPGRPKATSAPLGGSGTDEVVERGGQHP